MTLKEHSRWSSQRYIPHRGETFEGEDFFIDWEEVSFKFSRRKLSRNAKPIVLVGVAYPKFCTETLQMASKPQNL